MIHYTQCPVCHSTNFQLVLSARDHTVSKDKFTIWQCGNCSLRFTQDVPPQEEIGKYYRSEDYISHSDTQKGLVNSLYHQVRKITLNTKRSWVKRATGRSEGTLLDIGAGTGAFLNHMRSTGWKVEGVEPDPKAIEVAERRYKLTLNSPAELFGYADARFDAITMWHVLEHVHQLQEYIVQLKKLLKEDGVLLIAVPNYTSDDAAYYGEFWAAYDVPRHLYHFSPAAMKMLLQAHGFEICRLHPMWFDSFYVSLLSEKYKTGRSNLLTGFIKGFQSNLKAMKNTRLASSIVYEAKITGTETERERGTGTESETGIQAKNLKKT